MGQFNKKPKVIKMLQVYFCSRHKIVEFSNSNMSSTVAKPLALDNIGMRMIYCLEPSICAPFENQHGNEKMTHIGGILFFDLMELPETPKKVDKLIIRPSKENFSQIYFIF